jgi:predicted molibdopterin-dependent oxidoreductase YjgC
MVCAVGNSAGNFIPSCSTLVSDGMKIDASSQRVRNFRRHSLELMLSEHRGECVAPCQLSCPLHLDISAFLSAVASKNLTDAINIIYTALPLPEITCRLCRKNCEKVCRRKHYDTNLNIASVIESIVLEVTHPLEAQKNGLSIRIAGDNLTILAAADILCGKCSKITVAILDPFCSTVEKKDLSEITSRLKNKGVTFTSLEESKQIDADATILCGNACEFKSNFDNVIMARNLKPDDSDFSAITAGAEVARQLLENKPEFKVRNAHKLYNHHSGNPDSNEWNQILAGIITEQCSDLNVIESSRCLHCECKAKDECKLRMYATQYEAVQSKFKAVERQKISKEIAGNIVYESNKCIRCGICVKIGEKSGKSVVPVFTGKGLEIKMAPPIGHSLVETLEIIGHECVRSCPTGALSFKSGRKS